jgi:type IV pilus assembly protein PilA
MKRTRNNDRPNQEGFSLIELLIVVAIILVITAIALPAFNKAKRAANESAAVQTLKSIHSAESTFNTQYDNGFAPASALASAGDSCANAGLLPAQFTTADAATVQGGYQFTITADAAPAGMPAHGGCSAPGGQTWHATAVPVQQNVTGVRSFYIDQSGTVRYSVVGTPDATATPLGQ